MGIYMSKSIKLQIDVDPATHKKLRIKKIQMDAKNWTEFLRELANSWNE